MPEPTIHELIANLQELRAKATPLPWPAYSPPNSNPNNAHYAVAAANAAPRLADEVERLGAELKEWEDYWECESPHDTHVNAGIIGIGNTPEKLYIKQFGKEQERANRAENRLTKAEAELDRLRKGIEAAPHVPDCASRMNAAKCGNCGGGLREHVTHEPSCQKPSFAQDCNCWKSALAAGGRG